MHAVVTRVSVQDADAATKNLREVVVPGISQAPGFVAGYWVRLEGDEGTSVIAFESEEAAKAAAGRVREAVDSNPGVTLKDVTVGEVVASA
jgi:hypothetical protein